MKQVPTPADYLAVMAAVLFVILPLSLVMIWFAWKWQRLIVRVAVASLLTFVDRLANSTGDTFPQKVLGQTVGLVETLSHSPFGQSSAIRHKIRTLAEFMEHAEAVVSDPGVGLIFLHAPVPHDPHPYNRFTGRFDLSNKPLSGYVHSLALMDRMLAQWRQEMEDSGTWETTALLPSADHPDRLSQAIDGKSDPRVPFLLKLPGAATSSTFDAPFDTVIKEGSVPAILHRTVSSVPDAIAWLSQHRKDAEASEPASQ